MDRNHFFALLGGLALFLHGMEMMSAGCREAAGGRMRQLLGRFTTGRVRGVLTGAAVTAVIQSSSAVTVMAVGFLDAGLLTLTQACHVIMGANIGTTVTGVLIALNLGAAAPLAAFFGVAAAVFLRRERERQCGNILAGLGILLLGMEMMSAALAPLGTSDAFLRLVTRFEHPLAGIAAGALFTAAVQSSSASVGILQALAQAGAVPFESAVYVLFGQNIGTCVTAVLASVGRRQSAKQAAVLHLLFNVTGTVGFTLLCLFTPLTAAVEKAAPGNPAAQIADLHILFNVATTLLLLPFSDWLVRAAQRLVPEARAEKEGRWN